MQIEILVSSSVITSNTAGAIWFNFCNSFELAGSVSSSKASEVSEWASVLSAPDPSSDLASSQEQGA